MTSVRRPRAGLTLTELMLVIAILGIVAAAAFRPAYRSILHARVNRAATVVAGDLENALTLAARARTPVRLTFYGTTKRYTISRRSSGTVLLTRVLGTDTEYRLGSLSSSATHIDIFPNGIASSGLTVTVESGGYSRQVLMTRVGRVRVMPL